MSKPLLVCSAIVTDSKYRLPSEREGTPYYATAEIIGYVTETHNLCSQLVSIEGEEAIQVGTRLKITIEVSDG